MHELSDVQGNHLVTLFFIYILFFTILYSLQCLENEEIVKATIEE